MELQFPTIEADAFDHEEPSRRGPAAVAKSTEVTILADIAEVRDGKPVVQYDRTEARLAELRTRFEGATFDLTTTAGDKAARAARLELVKLRTGLEDQRKAHKAPAVEFGKLIDSEAKRLTAEIVALEEPIDAQIKADEQRRENERAERERIAAERRQKFEGQIATIRGYLEQVKGATSERITRAITFVDAITIGDEWEEFATPAAEAQAETLAAMRALHTETLAAERTALEAEALRVENARQAAKLAEMQRCTREIQRINHYVPDVQAAIVGQSNTEAAETIDRAIAMLEPTDTSPDGEWRWGDFAPMAEMAKGLVLAQLRAMRGEAQAKAADEAAQAEAARRVVEAQQVEPVTAQVDPEPFDEAPSTIRPLADVLPEAVAHIEAPIRIETSAGHMTGVGADFAAAMAARAKPLVEQYEPTIDVIEPDADEPSQGFVSDVLADLLAHIKKLDEMPFPSHPKPAKSWFDRLRELAAGVEA